MLMINNIYNIQYVKKEEKNTVNELNSEENNVQKRALSSGHPLSISADEILNGSPRKPFQAKIHSGAERFNFIQLHSTSYFDLPNRSWKMVQDQVIKSRKKTDNQALISKKNKSVDVGVLNSQQVDRSNASTG